MMLKVIDFTAQVTDAYTSLDGQKKLVSEFKKEPFLSESKSVGLFAFKCKVYRVINIKVSLDPNRVDFRSNITSQLLSKLMLAGLFILSKKWITIYTMKWYELVIRMSSMR